MIAALCLLLAAGVAPVQQEIPGLHVEGVSVIGQPLQNFRQADLNGDGAADLILPNQVFFQTAGAFDVAAPQPLPQSAALCDIWKSTLYLRLADKLQVTSWRKGAWHTELEQDIEWPMPVSPYDGVYFERFLFDIDQDGSPELAIASDKALHIFRKKESAYVEIARLDIFPRLHLDQHVQQTLWPRGERRIVIPPRAMSCRFTLDGGRLSVLGWEDVAPDSVRYTTRVYTLAMDDSGNVSAKLVEETILPLVPETFEPCRLNHDDALDFAGGDWVLSEAAALPVPIFETAASTNAGKTVQTVRTTSFRPLCSFVDFDADGRVDMVTESTGLFDGGVRESLSRFYTSKELSHRVQVRFQDASGGFSVTPDITSQIRIHLDAAAHKNSEMLRSYQSGRLVNVTGDFNGDGLRDLAVQNGPKRVAVYLNSGTSISEDPAFTVAIGPGERFAVTDVNGDGRSDIVVQWYEMDGSVRTPRNRIYFTQGEKP